MSSFKIIAVLIFLLSCPAFAKHHRVEIGNGVSQLFVDDFLIQSQSDLVRTLHQPKKENDGNKPLLALEDEFGEFPGTLEANGTIVYDPKLKKHVMFALAYASSMPRPDKVRLYRFTSSNGMDWIKGDDGKPEWIKFDLVDKASGRSAGNHDFFSCTCDARDSEYPYQGWLFLSNFGDRYDLEGLYFVRSRDGKQWEKGQQIADGYAMGADTTYHEIKQDDVVLRGPGDGSLFYHDTVSNRFLGIYKFYSPTQVRAGIHLRSRAYLFQDKLDEPIDFSRLKSVALVPSEANGDKPFDEYYISTAWRYASMWLGELKIWHGKDDYPYSAAGCSFIKFVSSRDGLNWNRVSFTNDAGFPGVFIPNGKEGGNKGRNDGGYITLFSQAPMRAGDELIYYYGASSWGKNHDSKTRVTGGGIFRARLRVDGFVSVDEGTLTTKRLRFTGKNLIVNGIGPIEVEILKPGDQKSPPKAVVQGDSCRHEIRFHRKILADIVKKDVVQLRFTVMPGGKLYSFKIQ